MPLEAFSSTASIVGALNQGVTEVGRSLLLKSGITQTTAAGSIQNIFASRIDTALANLNAANSTPVSDSLRQEQAILTGRKDRINNAINVLNKSLNQFQFLKNHVEYLEGEITKLEADTITASALATDWDNKLRKINQLIMAADESYEEAGSFYQKNLIGHLSRTSFQTQTFLAPYNSNGDNLLISGIYLGVDYFLTETSPGSEFWNSDTARAVSEEATGTLTEYTSFPNSPTGNTENVTSLNFTGFTDNNGSDDVVTFQQTNGTNVTATITRGGLGLLDAWLYDDFSTSVDSNSISRAKADLNLAESKILLAEAEFRTDLETLKSRANLFDALTAGIEKEIDERVSNLRSEKEAELSALQLVFQVAQFNFALLASRGNTLVFSLILAQDSQKGDVVGSTAAIGEALVGSTLSVQV